MLCTVFNHFPPAISIEHSPRNLWMTREVIIKQAIKNPTDRTKRNGVRFFVVCVLSGTCRCRRRFPIKLCSNTHNNRCRDAAAGRWAYGLDYDPFQIIRWFGWKRRRAARRMRRACRPKLLFSDHHQRQRWRRRRRTEMRKARVCCPAFRKRARVWQRTIERARCVDAKK